MSLILTRLKEKYIELRGFHTNRKLIVIESDDWGSIRTPSRKTLDKLISLGDNLDQDVFLRNDCLESEEDILQLLKTLSEIKDNQGRSAIMTMNFAMANPNFEDISLNNGVYAHEPFYVTYDKYYGKNNILLNIKNGYNKGYILPQLHCREHMNVNRWMKDLQKGVPHVIMAYENNMIGVGKSFSKNNIFGYMDAFNTDNSTDMELEEIVREANKMFEETFGYVSETFVAPCFVWNKALEQALHKIGIKYIQTSPWQYIPKGSNGKYLLKHRLHYTGEQNKEKQFYSVRNCIFEPAYTNDYQGSAEKCLLEIERAFRAKKPAVITSHRLNYIGSIQKENREKSLIWLKWLLENVLKKYPSVEFISSAELFTIMTQEKT